MRYLSLFSGIEAASVAWAPLGWEPVAFAEVDPFACAVLQHHYPDVPNLGDVTTITREQIEALGPIDLVVFGFPCQDLSVAGKRAGLAGERSGLFYDAVRIVRWSRARWAVAENVPGLFSSHRGRDFAAVVGTLVGAEFGVPGIGWQTHGAATGPIGMVEWGVLDAQWFGLAQRRKRVFLVLDTGDWTSRPPVLLESESLRRHTQTRRETRQVAPTLPCRRSAGGGLGTDFDCDGGLIPSVSRCLNAGVAHALRADGFDASEDGTGRGTPLVPVAANTISANSGRCQVEQTYVPVAFSAKDHGADAGEIAPTLRAGGHANSHANGGVMPAVAFEPGSIARRAGPSGETDTVSTLRARMGDNRPAIRTGMAVRRLTPRECARLQGFAADYLDITYRVKPAADGNKYKALGNSFAVPVVRWIGRRIAAVDALPE